MTAGAPHLFTTLAFLAGIEQQVKTCQQFFMLTVNLLNPYGKIFSPRKSPSYASLSVSADFFLQNSCGLLLAACSLLFYPHLRRASGYASSSGFVQPDRRPCLWERSPFLPAVPTCTPVRISIPCSMVSMLQRWNLPKSCNRLHHLFLQHQMPFIGLGDQYPLFAG